MDVIANIKEISGLIRDIGIILGVPFILTLGFKLYNQYISVLKEQNTVLKETQYDKALSLIKSQKELFEIERLKLEGEKNELQKNLFANNINNTEKEQSIQKRLEQIELEEKKLEEKKGIVEDLKAMYNNLFSDLQFVADFKVMFSNDNTFSYYHYGGMNESVSYYRNFALKLEKLELATYEIPDYDFEPGVCIYLTEHGIKFKELLNMSESLWKYSTIATAKLGH